jgi:hypothetical protein
MAHPLKAGQLFGVDMNHVPRLLPLVSLDRLFGLQVAQPAKAKGVHGPAHGREGHLEQSGDPPERASLMPQDNGLFQSPLIQGPLLAVAHAPPIGQCGCSTCAITGQPLVGRPQADSRLGRQKTERNTLIQVATDQAFPTDDCQSGHGVAMHGG